MEEICGPMRNYKKAGEQHHEDQNLQSLLGVEV
jgi:hypothetical protein